MPTGTIILKNHLTFLSKYGDVYSVGTMNSTSTLTSRNAHAWHKKTCTGMLAAQLFV